jgi:hypothetical protein
MIEILAWRHFLPCLLMAIDVLAAARYAYDRDWGRAIYWLSAAAITGSATFGMHSKGD